jgi:hypothetical protein
MHMVATYACDDYLGERVEYGCACSNADAWKSTRDVPHAQQHVFADCSFHHVWRYDFG